MGNREFTRLTPNFPLLAPAGIVESFAENRFHIEVDDNQVLLELLAAGDQLSILIKHETVTVKDEFILAADQIVIRDNHGVVGCARRQHPLPPPAFTGVIRRRRNIDDDLRSTR